MTFNWPLRKVGIRLIGATSAVAIAAGMWIGRADAQAGAAAQGQILDAYARFDSYAERLQNLAQNLPGPPSWLPDSSAFWYRKTGGGNAEFVLVDARAATKAPAFDHARLATSLSGAAGQTYTATALPFTTIDFTNGRQAIEFGIGGAAGRGGGAAAVGTAPVRWRCTLTDYTCARVTTGGGGGGRQGGQGRGGGQGAAGGQAPGAAATEEVRTSPDGKRQALVRNYNIYVRDTGSTTGALLSFDGSEGVPYQLQTIVWSPDSTKLAAYKVRPGHNRVVHYVESSPADQVQPKYSTRAYPKPGDPVDIRYPAVFDVVARRQHIVDTALFAAPYAISNLVWRPDNRAVTFEYNQRGHQVFRVIEIDAATGRARAVVSEEPTTYFNYYDKKYRRDTADGRETIWMSERDGWNHLYLYDVATGRVKNQITKGNWVVRDVDDVDEANRVITFRASGMHAGKDPYLQHHYRINFDGTGLVALTTADADHTLTFSPDRAFYVDTYSRVDLPTVAELRRSADQSLVMPLEQTDVAALTKAGWRTPEVFSAMGRDGKTDIWGVIVRPTNFDPSRRYPVIEYIYAGPHSAFVPKTFSLQANMGALAELGFVVVQIDGMGTSNRSKAFHDVAWKNIKDAGFPDRILWHKAVAAKYPYYDITRVGIFGNSAGGQNSTGALLFHGDFYKVAFSSVGCHDNRMDKISWNEQFMGWPVGPEYAASSNVDHAHRLTGRLMLLVGELDTNVDPSSTYQVANALIKANKDFELVVIPGAGHGSGGAFGARKRNDWFVRHLLGIEPPAWNSPLDATRGAVSGGLAALPAPAPAGSGSGLPLESSDQSTWEEHEVPGPRDRERTTRR
jgi:dipeptidyl aminopeptidase/acylaminoacyl peptidase